MPHALAGLTESQSNIVAAAEDGGSYSWTRRLWSAVYDKVFECEEHRADRNTSSSLPSLWPHTVRGSTHLLQEFGREVFIHHPPYTRTSRPVISSFLLDLKKFLSGQRQSFQNDREAEMSVTVVPITGGRLLRHRIQNLVPRYEKVSIPEVNILKNSSILVVSVPINLYIKNGFCFYKRPQGNLLCGRATYILHFIIGIYCFILLLQLIRTYENYKCLGMMISRAKYGKMEIGLVLYKEECRYDY